MSPDAFRGLALALPEASEGGHMGHADFRVRGKIFSSLGYPDAGFAMVRLTPDDQAMRISGAPGIFFAATGGWGRQGNTLIRLAVADELAISGALWAAWRKAAPKALVKALDAPIC